MCLDCDSPYHRRCPARVSTSPDPLPPFVLDDDAAVRIAAGRLRRGDGAGALLILTAQAAR